LPCLLVLMQNAWEAWLGDPANQVHIQAFQGEHHVNREQQIKLEKVRARWLQGTGHCAT